MRIFGIFRRTSTRNRRAVLLLSALSLLVASAPLGAHISPDPATVPAETRTVVSLEIGHGCGSEPTVSLRLKWDPSLNAEGISDEVFAASSDSEDSSVIVMTATTPISSEEPAPFQVAVTPETAGTFTLPIIQQCTTQTNPWTEVESSESPEPEFPAPQVSVTGGVAGDSPETESGHDAEDGSSHSEGFHDDESEAHAPETVDAESAVSQPSTGEHGEAEHSDSSNLPIIGGVVAIAVALGALVLVAARRKQRPQAG